MITERSDARQSYPLLPTHEFNKENSTRPAIDVQMDQISKQLTQLVDDFHRLSHEMKIISNVRQTTHLPNPTQLTAEKNINNHDHLRQEYRSPSRTLKRLGRRRKFSKVIHLIFILFLTGGIVAAFFSALILFFYGPAII